MNLTRRDLLKLSSAAAAATLLSNGGDAAAVAAPTPATSRTNSSTAATMTLDRRTIVRRHNPRVTRLDDPFTALTVGNGEFAFTADVTGLQTFTDVYEKTFPLTTAAHWAWHTTPPTADVRVDEFRYKNFDTYGRAVPYATDRTGQEPTFNWLRENPHRMHLGRIGLELPSREVEIKNVEQTLDLWSGLLVSRFNVLGQPVEMQTCVHPTRDLVAIRVRSPLLADKRLKLSLRFPYPSPQRPMADWSADPARHRSEGLRVDDRRAVIMRSIDDASYRVAMEWSAGAALGGDQPHEFILTSDRDTLELTCLFIREAPAEGSPSVAEVQSAVAAHWEEFWTTGGAIDLAASAHPHARELERRIVLSQYNTAVHCAGSLPSQETGLLFNSWNGKFHLEMHWWHSAHFVAWNRFPQFERSLGYYEKILPQARELARQQGFKGARWPKMTSPDGKDSPSPVGPLLIWQQPHPIHFAELCYRQHRDRATLERWRAVVEDSAEFMASYAHLVDGRYVLGPPMKTVSENADTLATINPTFELAYWRFGLSIAQQWRERLGQPRNSAWDDVLAKLSPLPTQDGLYLMQEGMADTYTKWNWEHPALLMPAAMLPSDHYDRETMRRTVRKVMETWQWDRAWGWDFGVAAAAAARVGEPELAIQALLIDSPKNRYHLNGHNYQRENLTAYLPGNGSLLAAVAAMAVTNAFDTKGWSAKWENLS
jgi:hypothetical protein